MRLDADSCYRAVKGRDRRFDGRFFTAVLTTGIYCRPICPARTPRRENVRFFVHAAAAEEAGFRACRRCRPEAAPGSPPWMGTSATVARALKLIDAGALDEAPVAELAERVGVGERQLRRLFLEHVGTSPNRLGVSRRLHLARRLIAQTALPVSEIAFASGFGSIRQFNDLFRRTFAEPPSASRARGARDGAATRLKLAYRPPYDWHSALGFLAARAIPGVERTDGRSYARTFATERGGGWLRVTPVEDGLELTVEGANARELIDVVRRVRRVFDLDADPAVIGEHLRGSAVLAGSVKRHPGLRIVGAFDPFEALVRAIVGQQVSVAAARAVLGRIVARFGANRDGSAAEGLTHVFPTAEALRAAPVSELPMPGKRAEALRGVAATFARGFSLEGDDVAERLLALPGIGPWTAQLLAMRAFAEPDAFPAGDLALRRAAGRGVVLPEATLQRQSLAWRPWRAYAAMHLWTLDRERAEEDVDADHAVAS